MCIYWFGLAIYNYHHISPYIFSNLLLNAEEEAQLYLGLKCRDSTFLLIVSHLRRRQSGIPCNRYMIRTQVQDRQACTVQNDFS